MSGAKRVRTLPRLRLRTARLVLRSWRRGDAAACKDALDSSLRAHDGQPRDTMVWELRADELAPQFAATYPVEYEDEEV